MHFTQSRLNRTPMQLAPTNTNLANRAATLRLQLRMAEEARLIGDRMRERRLELELTQRQIAERLPGSTQGADVSRWETGRHRPGGDTLDRIADALETTVADLVAGPVAERKAQAETPDLSNVVTSGEVHIRLTRIETMLSDLIARWPTDVQTATQAADAVRPADEKPSEAKPAGKQRAQRRGRR